MLQANLRPFSQATEIWLLRIEHSLKGHLDSGETPFLGLYSGLFTDKSRGDLRKVLGALRDPLHSYLYALKRWPAVFSAYLTLHIVEGYGGQGTHAVYPYVSRAIFGAELELALVEREKLWQAYRRDCIHLGLDVLPRQATPNYMVAEYLYQAGVPERYVPSLTNKMLRHAAVAGLPDEDDPEGITLWQEALIEHLGPPLSKTVKEAIQADGNGFYTRLFLRLLKGDATNFDRSETAIATLMDEAISAAGESRRHIQGQRLSIPKVVWRDEMLGVELPAGNGVLWHLNVDGSTTEHEGLSEPRFIPFDDALPLPGTVLVTRADNALRKEFALWGDRRNNRFLVFDAAGLLAGNGHLGMDEALLIEPGEITLITRFRPDGLEEEITDLSPNPALYCFSVKLSPGADISLRRGPAEARIQARSRSLLSLVGQRFRGVGGNELYATTGLKLQGQVPQELLATGLEDSLVVALTATGIGSPAEHPVTLEADGRFGLALESIISEWRPGLTRVTFELRRASLRRSMARLAAYVWNGLQRIDERVRFVFGSPPENLDKFLSDNLRYDEGLITFRSGAKRFFRMAFELKADHYVQFTGAVPGAFLYLKRSQEGQLLEQPLRKGSVLAVRSNSREVLEIHASQGGTLSLGCFRPEISPRSGMRRLHLSALAEYLEPGNSQLWIELPGQPREPLLELVTPHQVLGTATQLEGGTFAVSLDLPAAAQAMRCSAQEILRGKELVLNLQCNDAQARLDRTALAWLSCGERLVNGCFAHVLELPLERWPSGAWLLRLEVKLNGRWGALVNERQDVYAWGFLLDKIGAIGAAIRQRWLAQQLSTLDSEQIARVFKRVHRALLPCYAPDSWQEIGWLGETWRQLTSHFLPNDGQSFIELAVLDSLGPPETAQDSWFPLLSPGAAMPWIFARTATRYQELKNRAGLLGELAEIRPPLCDLFQQHYLESTVAFGYANIRQMQNGVPPQGFSLDRYQQAMASRNLDDAWAQLSREDWQPAEGDLLGPMHYHFALDSMRTRYRSTLSGNELRRGWALQLVRSSQNLSLGDLIQGYPANLNERDCRLGLMIEPPWDGWTQEQENLLSIVRFLWLFAGICRWEPRSTGALTAWQNAMNRIPLPNSDALLQGLGYLLYVGRDIFKFYLLLWELLFAADADADKSVKDA